MGSAVLNAVDLSTLYADAPIEQTQGRPLAIYLSVPFCKTKCHFCDWVAEVPAHTLRLERVGRKPYVTALCDQIRHAGPFLMARGYVPTVMYWGGGTPTRLEADELLTIWATLDASIDLSTVEQWSMETTPDLATPDRLEPLLKKGLVRLSIGLQSFDDEHLRIAGRSHNAAMARQAIEDVKRMGFPTFNIDLIAGFPQEGADCWRRTLETTLAFDPPHVSVYPYRPSEDTVMARQIASGHYGTLDTERQIEMYDITIELLQGAGYYEYIHGYWVRRDEDRDLDSVYGYGLGGDKLGLGSGADSLLGHHLVVNHRMKYDQYLKSPSVFDYAERFSLLNPSLLGTMLGGALMTKEGIHFGKFKALTGLDFEDFRVTPFAVRWLAHLESLGAAFIETAESIALYPELIHEVYIRYLTARQTLRPIWKQRDLLVQS
jgi:coproporphyrinogen III oxidase-like Fe-S oxidoreductase